MKIMPLAFGAGLALCALPAHADSELDRLTRERIETDREIRAVENAIIELDIRSGASPRQIQNDIREMQSDDIRETRREDQNRLDDKLDEMARSLRDQSNKLDEMTRELESR
jgi:hypothetical protein